MNGSPPPHVDFTAFVSGEDVSLVDKLADVATTSVGGSAPLTRDGHGIPKCSPCPSVVFLMLPGSSVHFRVFFGVVSMYVHHTER